MSVGLGVRLGGFASVVRGMGVVAMRRVGMVRGLFVTTGLVVFGGFLMVSGSVLMMLGSLMVMRCGFLRHNCALLIQNDLPLDRTEDIPRGVTVSCRTGE